METGVSLYEQNKMRDIRYSEKIIALWTAFLLGTLFHTQLGLMPLFHGQSVAYSQDSIQATNGIFWLMLGFFSFPLLAIITTLFWDSQRYRMIHFFLTIIYSVLNLIHLLADLSVKPILWYQIALMLMLLLIGLILNLVSYQWLKYFRKENISFGV
jgi:hypothetical protein